MICDLTGMDASNASVYDGASAAAEGVAMCRERKRAKALISGATSPYVIQTIQTYCHGNGMEMEVIPEKDGKTDWEKLKARLDPGQPASTSSTRISTEIWKTQKRSES